MFGERCANCPYLQDTIEQVVKTIKEGHTGSVQEICKGCYSVAVIARPASNTSINPARRRIILDIQPIGVFNNEHNSLEKSCQS